MYRHTPKLYGFVSALVHDPESSHSRNMDPANMPIIPHSIFGEIYFVEPNYPFRHNISLSRLIVACLY